MPDPNWPPINLVTDLNFGHCNTTNGFEDAGYDQDGHCHGSSDDSTYYWWIRDHWHRQYNGRLRCCCGWYEGNVGDTPIYSRRIANGCDYRRKVVDDADRLTCRDANEDHGLGFYDIGCDQDTYGSQLGSPIPENDSMCWEVQKFGFSEGDTPPPSGPSTSAPVKTPTSSAPVKTPTSSAPVKTPTSSAPVKTPATSAPVSVPTPTGDAECVDSPLKMLVNGKLKTCGWAASKNTEKRCNKRRVASHCPATCDEFLSSCDFTCEDSEKRFKMNNNMSIKGCAWVGRDEDKVDKRCAKTGVTETCRDTCGYCEE
eukprot:CAMPEP_0197245802 /NCGR_PEP_ID=MMETSP1429-20130617/10472_1 /TAXON_ID=49237 /ORGANISM="Chaetoceros  sp., Strain UNC1202" /LENGTH=312 /DNA_ID=CAMNT_0042706359 /DNA_START=62 /DNA_END=1000 /DNA_ORIENTATION=+